MSHQTAINEKSAATSVLWPRSIPSASSEIDSHSLFDRLIKIVNGKFSDLYARDNYLINRKGWTRKGGRLYEPASESMLRIRPSVDDLYRGRGGGAALPAQVAKTNQKTACAPCDVEAPEMEDKRVKSAVEEINAMVKSAAWWNPFSWGNSGPSYTENQNYVQRHPADARGISREAWDRQLGNATGMQSDEIQRLRNMKPRTYLPSPGTRDPELARLMPGRSRQFWDSAWNRQDSLNRNGQIASNAKSTQIMNQANSGIRDEGRKIVRQMIAARNGGAKIDDAKMRKFRDQYSRFRSGQMTDEQARAMLNGWRRYASTLKSQVQNKAMAQTPAANPAGRPGAV